MPLTVCVYLHSNFSGELRKTILFRRGGRFRRSRSSKVDNFGANRKRGVDFLLVHNTNFGPILHRFRARTRFMCYLPHPYSTPILGVFPLHQIAHVGRQPAHAQWAHRRCIAVDSTSRPDVDFRSIFGLVWKLIQRRHADVESVSDFDVDSIRKFNVFLTSCRRRTPTSIFGRF